MAMTNPREICGYRVDLTVDLFAGLCQYRIQTFGPEGTEVSRVDQEEVTTFCFDWKDLALSVERQLTLAGYEMPNGMSRPSPYVDLT